MPATAGQIVIDVTAGTAKMVLDMEAAKTKIREFGNAAHESVSGVQAVSASLRVLEGNTTNNLRAAERWVASLPGVASALRVAFPVVGAVAFLGIIGEMGKKVHDFFKEVHDAPKLIDEAFRSLNDSARTSADELRTANDRLINDIDKLQGKRENTAALALDEARLVADRLGESLDSDIQKMSKLLSEHQIGLLASIATGQTQTGYIKDRIEGFGSEIQDKVNVGYAQIDGAKTPAAAKVAVEQLGNVLAGAFDAQIADFQQKLRGVIAAEKSTVTPVYNEFGKQIGEQTVPGKSNAVERVDLERAINNLFADRAKILAQVQNYELTGKKETLEAADALAKQENPFKKWQAESAGAIAELKANRDAIGKPESVQIATKAWGDAQKALAKLNEELREHKGHLTAAQAAEVQTAATTKAQIESDTEWDKKLASANTSIDERIKSQERLTAAIGQGYAATRAANVETRLAQELGEHANDPEWLRIHSGDVAGLRAGYGAEFDAQHGTQTSEALQKLNEQITLERSLAAVQAQGAEAVRQAGLAIKLQQIARDNDVESAKKLMAAEVALYAAQRENAVAGEVEKLHEQTEATERLAAATLKGAAAVRQARLENELSKIASEGDTPVPGLIGIGARGLAAIGADSAAQDLAVSQEAAHADRVQEIQDRINILSQAKQTMAVEIAIRDLENQKLQAMVQQTLQLGTARDGFRAFFLEMQENAETTATMIYNELNSALDKTAENLANMATGNKPKGGWSKMWGGELKDLGHEAVSSGIKSALHIALGDLGKKLGIAGKPDGSQQNPYWVKIEGGTGNSATSAQGNTTATPPATQVPPAAQQSDIDQENWDDDPGPPVMRYRPDLLRQVPSFLTAIFGAAAGAGGGGDDSGGGGGIPNVTSSISFGGSMAIGGNMDPGKIYQVAEAGEGEIVTPRNASTITPLSKLGGGDHFEINYNIDAKGAQLGVENRIARAIDASHKDSVSQALRAKHEMARRTPRGRR